MTAKDAQDLIIPSLRMLPYMVTGPTTWVLRNISSLEKEDYPG